MIIFVSENNYNTVYKSKCAFGSFQSQRHFDLVTAFTIVL